MLRRPFAMLLRRRRGRSGRKARLAPGWERAETERALLAKAVEQCGDAILISDREGRILYANPAFERSCGYTLEELKGQTPRVLKSGKHEPAFYEDLWRTILSGKVFQGEFINRRKDGSLFYVDRSIAPMVGASGRIEHFVATGHDAAPRHEKEEAARRLNEELERRVAERTAELSAINRELESFVYTVSHDLRSPLHAIEGYAHFARQRLEAGADPAALAMLTKIGESTVRLDRLIRDVLSYSGIARTGFAPAPVDLDEIVAHVVGQYSDLAQARLDIRGPLGVVLGQESLMIQVVSNLLANAVKFVPAGKTPEVAVWTERRAGGKLLLNVKDNGIGIAKEHRARIFEPFARLPAAQGIEGTGIGLAIVKKAVERMGGSVCVDSEPGKGSLFLVELPEAGHDG